MVAIAGCCYCLLQNSADPGNVASNKGWTQSRPFTMVTEILQS